MKGCTLCRKIKNAPDIWQIHPFCEGNTRATAVFMIKYMKTFGFDVSNEVFASDSWYFRNALVRANYNNLKAGVHATTKFLELFFSNLLTGTKYELKNRYLHIDYHLESEKSEVQSANSEAPKCQNGTLNGTLEEMVLLKKIMERPTITQTELSEQTGKPLRTIKREMAVLREKGCIRRINGNRNGKWEVLIDLFDK